MKVFFRIIPLLSLILAFGGSDANAQAESHYTIYKTSGPIVADGFLNEPSWKLAEWSRDFVDITGDPLLKPSLQTRVKLLWDDRYLYVAAQLNEPDVWGTITQQDAVIFQDNDFEIFLDIDGNGINYYELEVNALGTVWDLLLTKPYRDGGQPVTSWNLAGLKCGVMVNGTLNNPQRPDTSWTVEMALPLDGLMNGKQSENRPAEGVRWRANFSRVEWKTTINGKLYEKIRDTVTGKIKPEQNWVWSPMKLISMHLPERWGWLEFSSSDIRPGPLTFKNRQQQDQFRIWLWMGGHPYWEVKTWDSVLASLRKAGVTGLLIQADAGTLAKMIPVAGKHNIRVEAWFVAMMNNNRELLTQDSAWFVVSGLGKSCISDPAYVGYYRFLCPSNPAVRDYLRNRLDDYLKIPGLSGIHLDYIRYPDVILPRGLWSHYGIVQDKEYPQYDYCYCDLCREKFRRATHVDPLLLEHPDSNATWRQFRYEQITSLVGELKDHCTQQGKKLSAAVFPGPSIARSLVRQDWDRWNLDEVFPMLYQNFYYGSLDWIRKETAEGVASLRGRAPLYAGLYIPSLTPRDLQNAIGKSLQGGATGICLFNYESMTHRHWQAIRELFNK